MPDISSLNQNQFRPRLDGQEPRTEDNPAQRAESSDVKITALRRSAGGFFENYR
jgi:hypothetical protein